MGSGCTLRGGVANIGNSCYVSVVLQEFAQFPRVYQELCERVPSLAQAVQSLRSGELVNPDGLLHEVQWRSSASERIYRVLCDYLPALFVPAPGSPFRFYEHLCAGYAAAVLTVDDAATGPEGATYDVDQRVQALDPLAMRKLVRVRVPIGMCPRFSESVRAGDKRLRLMQVHYSPYPEHIVTACRVAGQWLHFDDDYVNPGRLPAADQSVVLIYGVTASSSSSSEETAGDSVSLERLP